jgi:hypothetical protein
VCGGRRRHLRPCTSTVVVGEDDELRGVVGTLCRAVTSARGWVRAAVGASSDTVVPVTSGPMLRLALSPGRISAPAESAAVAAANARVGRTKPGW